MVSFVVKKRQNLLAGSIAMSLKALATIALCVAVSQPAQALAIRGGGFNSNILPRNDDGSTGAVNIGFNTNFFGNIYSQLFVNNNGNVTFNSPLGTFTPFGISGATTPIIAPFFADVDTRNPASGVVSYGAGTVGGRSAFGVNWPNVGYFSNAVNRLNNFQLVLIDRSDIAAGDFDIESTTTEFSGKLAALAVELMAWVALLLV